MQGSEGLKIKIPQKVNEIIQTIRCNEYEAYAVGGCVRDAILGRNPQDWDITTSAKPEEVKALFRRTIDTGIEHGTVTVMLGKEGFEVTTYRIDGEYEDGRHPKEVEFTASLEEDLKRRDFTINAMAYNEEEGIIDLFDGIGDLKRGVIKCVGNPMERFSEDALRILRGVRFAGQLGFLIDKETKEAMGKKASTLEKISAERIRVELDKLLRSQHPEKIIEAYEIGITSKILPELDAMLETRQNNPYHCYDVGTHCIKAVEYMNKIAAKNAIETREHSVLCWTAFLHDVGKPIVISTDENGIDHFYRHEQKGEEIAIEILKRLKFDNYTMNLVSHLILWHDYPLKVSKKSLRRCANKLGTENMEFFFYMKEADIYGQSDLEKKARFDLILNLRELYKEVLDAEECVSLKDLAITGRDLIEIGMEPGKQIGFVLNSLLEKVLEKPELNRRDKLLEETKKIL